MSKPEIIGYESDPNAPEDQLAEAEFWDIHGVGVHLEARMHTWPYSTVEINDDNRTAFFRSIGLRPIYRERPFHARLKYGGYLILCRVCDTHSLTSGYLPHDYAELHTKRGHKVKHE